MKNHSYFCGTLVEKLPPRVFGWLKNIIVSSMLQSKNITIHIIIHNYIPFCKNGGHCLYSNEIFTVSVNTMKKCKFHRFASGDIFGIKFR